MADQIGHEAAAANGRLAKRVPTWVKWVSVAIVLVTTIGVPVALFESQSDALVEGLINWTDRRPLITALVLILALTSDVLFPVPNGVINTAAGSLFGWTLGAGVIWIGLTIGCLLGYGVGRVAGRPLARRIIGERDMAAAHAAAERLGAVTLVVTRTVPMVGDIATIAAGITVYPFSRYVLVTALANAGVAVVFAGIGSAATDLQSPWLALLGAVALPLAAWLGYRAVRAWRARVP